MDPIDQPIQALLAIGDPRGLAALYDRHGRVLHAYLVAVTGSAGAADDALQDCFVALAEDAARAAVADNLVGFCLRLARAWAIDRMRRVARLRALPAHLHQADPAEPADLDPLRAAVAALPGEQREIVALHAYAGLTFAACARQLGISENTCASRYRLALDRLRAALRQEEVA